MPKRKREDDEGRHAGDDDIEDQALRIRVSRLRAKIEQGNKELTSSLKLARGFERQKLGRRQKAASKEPHTLLRLREEVIVLKQLQLDRIARNYLLKHLVKTKRIRESPAFIKIYGLEPVLDTVKPGAEANVIGRLFNSAPIKQVIPKIMKSVYAVLRIEPTKPESVAHSATPSATLPDARSRPLDEDTFTGFSESDQLSDEDEQRSAKFGSEAGDSETYGDPLVMSSTESNDAILAELDEDIHDTEDTSLSSSSREDSTDDKAADTSGMEDKPLKTTFLPSLSVGGYYSGSDSEDGFQQDGLVHPIRKNRRGQRARQRLAELKYGNKAKHLQKPNEKAGHNAGWDPKRGAVDGDAKFGKRKFGRVRTGSERAKEAGGGITTGGKSPARHKDDQGPLHPSWEAAKQRKLQSATAATFSGKRITFD